MPVSVIRQAMRGSARKKKRKEMGFVFAHKTLLPRGINN